MTLLCKLRVSLAWKCFDLTWPASLHVSHRSLRGKQIRFPVAQREAPRRCADGEVAASGRPPKRMHGMQHVTGR